MTINTHRPARLLDTTTSAVFMILFAVLVTAVVLVEVFGRGGFLTGEILSNVVQRSVALGIVAIGQTFTILIGSLDLSVAYVISLSAVMASFIMQGDPAMIVPAVLAVLAIGLCVGVVNGLIITRLQVNPLIATLGTGFIIQGVLSASFQNFAGSVPESFQALAYGHVGGVPAPIVLWAGLIAVAIFVLRYTTFGAHIYAVGGNAETARLSGIRTERVVIGAHVTASVSASLTGLYLASRLGAGAPWIGPEGVYGLESIAAVVIGGTILAGGRGGVAGTVAGVLIFGLLDSMFNQMGIDAFLKQVLRGLIIIAAVASYSIRSADRAA